MRAAALGALSLAAVVAAGVAGRALPPPGLAAADFFEYRAAAEVLARGGDPYDGKSLLEVQLPGGWVDDKSPPDAPRAQMMWNPPWVAPLILPFAAADWGPGYLAWCALQTWLVAASALLLWWTYGERTPLGYLAALAVALVFSPDYWLVVMGQISGYLLFGVAGFAAAMHAGRPGLAGAALALTAVKPHLLLPLGVLLGAAAVAGDRAARRAALVGGAILILAALAPLPLRPGVWGEYFRAAAAPGDEFHFAPSQWNPPIPAGYLRRALGLPTAAQFVPSVVVTAALVAHWWPRRRGWDWPNATPPVVLLSVLSTGYGAWLFDLCVLLVPVTQAAAWLARSPNRLARLVGAAALAAFAASVNAGVFPKVLWTSAIALGYVGAWLAARRHPGGPAGVSPRLLAGADGPLP